MPKSYDDDAEVTIYYSVAIEVKLGTTIGEIRRQLALYGDTVIEPDMSDGDDATEYAYALLEANDGIRRDAWLTTDVERETLDETVSIEEVS